MRTFIHSMRRRSAVVHAVLFALATLLLAGTVRAQGESGYRVVVNAKNGVGQMSRDELSRLFLKKTTSWSNGQLVAIVDRAEASDVRQKFTEDVHQRQVRAVKRYWQQMIFGGRAVPPPEKASDDEVLAFVRSNPNAIGYVSAATSLGDGVKPVSVAP
jgi:ABC-type phosphate transport system substrate-binding protein